MSSSTERTLQPKSPPLYREDLLWHEQPQWFLLSAVCCAVGSSALGIGLLALTKRPELVWVLFIYVITGLAFGSTLGPRYLSATRTLWTVFRNTYHPLWKTAEGRCVGFSLTFGWFLATLAAYRFGQSPDLARSLPSIIPERPIVIGVSLGIQFGLWSGVTLMVPIYRWLKSLPRRP